MSIDRLRYFAAVVETRNLRRAAELVGISPPSMSKAIGVLEQELGLKLLYPEGRGIGITAKGLEVYRLAASLLEEHHLFHRRLRLAESAAPRRLRLATFEVFSSYFLAAFLGRERELSLLALEMTPGQIEEAILAGTVELGLTYLPFPDPALEYREVGSFSMGLFGRPEWGARPFAEWPFAIPTTALKMHSAELDSLDLWPRAAPRRHIKYQFELLETALQTARRGLAVLHCPSFVVRLQNEQVKAACQLAPLPPPASYRAPKQNKIYLVGRKGSVPETLERKLASFLRTLRKEG